MARHFAHELDIILGVENNWAVVLTGSRHLESSASLESDFPIDRPDRQIADHTD
jgi:hypothetical protein